MFDGVVAVAPEHREVAQENLLELYKDYCAEEGCRVNSSLVQYMADRGGVFAPDKIALGGNYLGPKGLRPVIRLIDACQTVISVDIENNGADNGTVEALCEVLKRHIGVTSLNIRHNPISTAGGRMLLQLLEDNPRITSIDVSGTDIFESLQDRIKLAAEVNDLHAQRYAQHLVAAEAEAVAELYGVASTFPPIVRPRKQKPVVRTVAQTVTAAAAAPEEVDGAVSPSKTLPSPIAPSPPPKKKDQQQQQQGVVGRLPLAQLRALRQKFDDRARIFAEVSRSEASRHADLTRRELMAMERTSRPAASKLDVPQPLPPIADAHEEEANAAAEANGTPMTAGGDAQESSVPHLPDGGDEEDQHSGAIVAGGDEDTEAYHHVDFHGGALMAAPGSGSLDYAACSMEYLSAEERFQILFDQGCLAYTHKNLDAAYMAWNEAMLIATERNNREWMSVVSSNLQRLSYELLVSEGVAQLNRNELQEATKSFNLALEVAVKARNAIWETSMHKALKQVQCALFHRCYEAATQIFDTAKDSCLSEKRTASADGNDDEADCIHSDGEEFFVVPGTEKRIKHTKAFVREWAWMLQVREAVAIWSEAFRVASRVGGTEAAALRETVSGALTSVACFLVQVHFSQGGAVDALTLYGTSQYLPQECLMLGELWIDIIAYVDQGMHHHLMCVVASLQLGHLYLATNQLALAEQRFASALQDSHNIGDDILEASSWMSCGLLNWQRSNYGPAENQLEKAIDMFKQLRATHSESSSQASGAVTTAVEPKSDVAAVATIASAVPATYAHAMLGICQLYMVTTLTATYRYKEALECMEHSLINQYYDVLYDKMLATFPQQPSADQIASISESLRTPLVYYLPTRRYEWDVDADRFDIHWSLSIWVVPQGTDLRYVDVKVTKHFKQALPDLIHAIRRGMHIDPIEGEGVAEDIITDTHRKAWIEPLQTMYSICFDPIIDFIRVADPLFNSNNALITIVPCGLAWLIPFHALMTKNDTFLVENVAVQLAFSATQAAFASLSAKRVRQQDTYRDVVVVYGEDADGDALHGKHLRYAPDIVRSRAEGEQVVSAWQRIKEEQLREAAPDPTATVTANSEVVVTDVETLRGLLPRARMLHVTTAVTTSHRSVAASGREYAGAIFMHAGEGDGEDLMRASELSHSELFAEMVALSCTNMNPDDVSSGTDNVLGVTRSLFSSGTPCVVLGQWCTPDMKPSEVFTRLYAFQSLMGAASSSVGVVNTVRGGTTLRSEALTGGSADYAPTSAEALENGSIDWDDNESNGGANRVAVAVSGPVRGSKTLSLAYAIRSMLEDPAVRYNPRSWAGYYCVGTGIF